MVWSYLGLSFLISPSILQSPSHQPVFPCQRLSVGQHGELVDDGRVQELHVVRPRLDPAESSQSLSDDDGVSASHLSGQAPLLPAH